MALTTEQQSAFDIIKNTLEQYGLGALSGTLKDLMLGGITNENEIMLHLQETGSWKMRFAGNEMLRKNGLPVLSVAEYLSVERSYAQIMRNFGLPAGFYDDPSDFANFIGGSVSPNEVQQRAQMFADIANREDPAVIAQLEAMGMSKGDITAWFMDSSRALPLIQKKYQMAVTGAAARRAGVVASNDTLAHLAELGVSEQQAAQGFGQIGSELRDSQRLGDIYGDSISQNDLEREVFDQDSGVAKRRKRLASQERANFSGSAGTTGGSLGRTSSGTY